MKFKFLFLFLILFLFNLGFSQELSEVQKLHTTAKIWGFLKYYHPEVAIGNFDWDQQLIEVLPKVREAKNNDELSKVYGEWITGLGIVNKCKSCSSDSKLSFEKNFDLAWISDANLMTSSITMMLRNIEENRFQGRNFYVVPAQAGNVVITNETEYKDSLYPNVEYRLLGLFRYWNIIEYFYPYKYLLDKNWNEVLALMIPKFIDAPNEVQYKLAIKELVASVDDSHTWIHFEDRTNLKYFPYLIKNIDNNCVIAGFYNEKIAEKEGLEMGDIILAINGKDVQQEVLKEMKYTPASNLNRKICYIYLNLLNSTNRDNVELTIKRGNQILHSNVNLYKFYEELRYYDSTLNKTWELLEDGKIGYIRMRLLEKNNKEIKTMMKTMMNTNGIIFDLRGYPRTTFYTLATYLNSEKKNFARTISPDFTYPGKFLYGKNLQAGKKNNNSFKGKVVILVDEQSLSLSEFAAMCLQTADNSITVGSQTAAADGNVSIFDYMGGFKTAVSGKGMFYPDGSDTQRVGIKIDYEISPTLSGLKEGRDEILEKAIEIISEKK